MFLVTGSSGYVGSSLMPMLRKLGEAVSVDVLESPNTSIVSDIASPAIVENLTDHSSEEFYVINLAAARSDFGWSAQDYYRTNVESHEKFLSNLEKLNVTKFVHVSSVASFNGRVIPYNCGLNCDDAYRSTKYLQEDLIRRWCNTRGIDLVVLYPSAIFSKEERTDTNMGKLQTLSKFIPFIPLIKTRKTVTFLPHFCEAILAALNDVIPPGNYLAVERPVLSVSEMLQLLSGSQKPVVSLPLFRRTLLLISMMLYVLGGFGRVDLKLTPNRVVKLFSDTTYADTAKLNVDEFQYNALTANNLDDILQTFGSD